MQLWGRVLCVRNFINEHPDLKQHGVGWVIYLLSLYLSMIFISLVICLKKKVLLKCCLIYLKNVFITVSLTLLSSKYISSTYSWKHVFQWLSKILIMLVLLHDRGAWRGLFAADMSQWLQKPLNVTTLTAVQDHSSNYRVRKLERWGEQEGMQICWGMERSSWWNISWKITPRFSWSPFAIQTCLTFLCWEVSLCFCAVQTCTTWFFTHGI